MLERALMVNVRRFLLEMGGQNGGSVDTWLNGCKLARVYAKGNPKRYVFNWDLVWKRSIPLKKATKVSCANSSASVDKKSMASAPAKRGRSNWLSIIILAPQNSF